MNEDERSRAAKRRQTEDKNQGPLININEEEEIHLIVLQSPRLSSFYLHAQIQSPFPLISPLSHSESI